MACIRNWFVVLYQRPPSFQALSRACIQHTIHRLIFAEHRKHVVKKRTELLLRCPHSGVEDWLRRVLSKSQVFRSIRFFRCQKAPHDYRPVTPIVLAVELLWLADVSYIVDERCVPSWRMPWWQGRRSSGCFSRFRSLEPLMQFLVLLAKPLQCFLHLRHLLLHGLHDNPVCVFRISKILSGKTVSVTEQSVCWAHNLISLYTQL